MTTIEITDITSGDTHEIDSNTPCVVVVRADRTTGIEGRTGAEVEAAAEAQGDEGVSSPTTVGEWARWRRRDRAYVQAPGERTWWLSELVSE